MQINDDKITKAVLDFEVKKK